MEELNFKKIPEAKFMHIARVQNQVLNQKGENFMENSKKLALWKPALLIGAILLLSVLILAGCGETSLNGTWTLSKVTNGETVINAGDEDLGEYETAFNNKIVFNDDGTGSITINDAEPVDMTWKRTDNSIAITANETDTVYTLSGSELTLTDGDTKYFYTKL